MVKNVSSERRPEPKRKILYTSRKLKTGQQHGKGKRGGGVEVNNK
jgi:hypothetical protein